MKVFLAKDEEAVGATASAIEANRNFAVAHFYLAVALAELGRLDEARLEARDGAFHRSHIHHPPLSRRRAERQPGLSRGATPQIYEMMRRVGSRKDSRTQNGGPPARPFRDCRTQGPASLDRIFASAAASMGLRGERSPEIEMNCLSIAN